MGIVGCCDKSSCNEESKTEDAPSENRELMYQKSVQSSFELPSRQSKPPSLQMEDLPPIINTIAISIPEVIQQPPLHKQSALNNQNIHSKTLHETKNKKKRKKKVKTYYKSLVPATMIDIKINKGSFTHIIRGKITSYYKLVATLGSGSYGCVHKAMHKVSGNLRAIKSIKKRNTVPHETKKLMEEVEILKSLDHPNIINIIEVIEDIKSLNIVMDLCTGGELFDKIAQRDGFTENQVAGYMFQLISAVVCCHKHGIVHRDLKPENIMLQNSNPDSPIIIIDFGTSKVIQPDTMLTNLTGTAYYIAPEVLSGYYNEKCDVWSCGIIMYILLSGKPPFVGRDDKSIFANIRKGVFSFNGQEWSKVSKEAKALIMKMLTRDPDKRPSAFEVFNDSWIQKRAKNLVADNRLDSQTLSNLNKFKATRVLQKAIMEFIVSHLTAPKETEKLRKLFIQMDKDGDGQLSFEEVSQAYLRTGKKIENIEEIFASCDTDKNGYIEYTEFLTATINWKKTLSQEKLESAFRSFDIDGDGSITKEELCAFFGGGNDLDNKVWTELLEQADNNGDGEIDINEFKSLMLQNF